ncbi:MAG: hypothetical protein KDH95_21950 [Calditrichaeota bacterium]|nr:hypothetical protein [Calditrichota bacterium]MCB0270838.1 hypothetical protein [Calditrichota bacterium]
MKTFWIALLILVLVGHVIWFIIYAIRVLKNDDVQIHIPEKQTPGDDQSTAKK